MTSTTPDAVSLGYNLPHVDETQAESVDAE